MRDHWQQCQTTIHGGTWGSVKGKFADMKELIEKWYKNEAKRSKADLANDQLFLKVGWKSFCCTFINSIC